MAKIYHRRTNITSSIGKLVVRINTPQCTLKELSPSEHTYQLLDGMKRVLTIYMPSSTSRNQFLQILQASAASEDWIMPPRDVFRELIDVANVIVETDLVDPESKYIEKTKVKESDIAAYLERMKPIYDKVVATTATKSDLYDFFLQQEDEYIVDRRRVRNLAHAAHQQLADYMVSYDDMNWEYQSFSIHQCPHSSCSAALSKDVAFDIHIGDAMVECSACHQIITYPIIHLAHTLAKKKAIEISTVHGPKLMDLPPLPVDGSYNSYRDDFARALKAFETSYGKLSKQGKKDVQTALGATAPCIDLVRAMSSHLQLISQVCSQYNYWSHQSVILASLIRYRKYRQLCIANTTRALIPTVDISLVRCVHNTLSTLQPFKLPKSPDLVSAAYTETFMLWREKYNSAYSSYMPDIAALSEAAERKLIKPVFSNKKWHSLCTIPAKDASYVGVNEYFTANELSSTNLVAINEMVSKGDVEEARVILAVIGTPALDDRVAGTGVVSLILHKDRLVGWDSMNGMLVSHLGVDYLLQAASFVTLIFS